MPGTKKLKQRAEYQKITLKSKNKYGMIKGVVNIPYFSAPSNSQNSPRYEQVKIRAFCAKFFNLEVIFFQEMAIDETTTGTGRFCR